MFRLIVATLAALVAILQIFGDPARKPEVSRAAPEGLTLAAFAGLSESVEETPIAPTSSISDAEAVAIAIEAGKRVREGRTAAPTATFAHKAELVSNEVNSTAYWMVSGSRVNLRKGPGTSNAVIGQVTLGTEAEVLEQRNGWMQIVTRDGSATGWISGKFLKEQLPG